MRTIGMISAFLYLVLFGLALRAAVSASFRPPTRRLPPEPGKREDGSWIH